MPAATVTHFNSVQLSYTDQAAYTSEYSQYELMPKKIRASPNTDASKNSLIFDKSVTSSLVLANSRGQKAQEL